MTEKIIKEAKLDNAIEEIISYAEILSDYMSYHDSIPEMLHASLLIYKIQEQLDIIKNSIREYEKL